ncbi:hypothetical protein [Streptomyces misionensis]|uniref:hypothetical protein n=1 Tax=Streptomyces misionensis TaxID=67331 RepID=UPI00368D26E5
MERTETRPQPPSLTARGPFHEQHATRVGNALHALCSPATEPWPEGVIARYLTAAGATVDLTLRHTPPESKPYATLADCNGCPAAEEFGHYRTVWGLYSEREEHNPNAAETDARKWAQRHASECRALPRPAVNQ